MLREQSKLIRNIAVVLDVLSIFAAFFLAWWFVFSSQPTFDTFTNNDWFLILALPIWIASLWWHGVYSSLRIIPTVHIFRRLFLAHFWGTIFSAAVIYLFKIPAFSRTFFVSYLVVLFLIFIFTRIIIRAILALIRSGGKNARYVVIVGGGQKITAFLSIIDRNPFWGLKVIGIVSLDDCNGDTISQLPVIGRSLDDLMSICRKTVVDEVVFCLPMRDHDVIHPYICRLDMMGITSRLILDFIESPTYLNDFSLLDNKLPMITYHAKAFDQGQILLKRILDIIGGVVGVSILLIMLPFVALAIRIDSPGPVFFGQERVGENGRRFKCWKFRSMYVDAEERKKELLARNEMSGAMFKMENDPRITRVGRFIRKTSIDEFPQFWNVLRGEMSIAGTRPPTPDEVEHYEEWHLKRICIKPGITGLWQVSGRNEIKEFDKVALLDIQYIENWTIWLDIKIILQTIVVVLTGKGAR